MAKILLIEDEKLIIRLYTDKLRDEGFIVTNAETGPEGLILAKSSKPDLIILDILMPGGLHGLEVLDQLKADPQTKDIPVIVLTGLDDNEIMAKLKGASEFMIKDKNDPSDVIKVVNKLLGINSDNVDKNIN